PPGEEEPPLLRRPLPRPGRAGDRGARAAGTGRRRRGAAPDQRRGAGSIPVSSAALAARLAWRQLTSHRLRLVTASLGVAFACFLVFMQFGFRDSLYASVEQLPRALRGHLVPLHPQTGALM